ncbi:MAG TPA: GNAT family N-acetyltransferase [Pyrinomonadaceae bacterium]|nr:GNAT family N-acetyltransferase [Pyrinomonadaceae bacterium]
METERLFFKLYGTENKADFINLTTDETIMKHVDLGVLTLEKAEELWKKLIEEFYTSGKNTIYAVFAKDDKRYLGHAAIRPRPTKTEDWEISYMLRTEEWGKGFATEIAKRLIRFGFEELNLTEVFATIDDANLNSMKVVEKAGMIFLHREFDDDGGYSVYSIKKLSYQS